MLHWKVLESGVLLADEVQELLQHGHRLVGGDPLPLALGQEGADLGASCGPVLIFTGLLQPGWSVLRRGLHGLGHVGYSISLKN